MYIEFRSRKLEKLCTNLRAAQREWKHAVALKVAQRISELSAAEQLADLMTLPQLRCHRLKGNRAGQFAIDVVSRTNPIRVVFSALEAGEGMTAAGIPLGVRSIRIEYIGDYHDD